MIMMKMGMLRIKMREEKLGALRMKMRGGNDTNDAGPESFFHHTRHT